MLQLASDRSAHGPKMGSSCAVKPLVDLPPVSMQTECTGSWIRKLQIKVTTMLVSNECRIYSLVYPCDGQAKPIK